MDRPSSGRPPSAKPQVTRNPITGEETPVRTPSRADSRSQSRLSSKPTGVPDLNLKYLKETEDYAYQPIELANYPLDSARSDVSWGTPVSTARSFRNHNSSARQQEGSSLRADVPGLALRDDEYVKTKAKVNSPKPKQASAWDKPPVPSDVPPPSARHKQLYQKYEDDMKEAYKASTRQELTEAEIERVVEEMWQTQGQQQTHTDDVIGVNWTKRQNLTSNQLLRRMEAEDLVENNKKEKLIETVMVDQLSRAVISDPEQNVRSGMTTSAGWRPRGSNRSLHDSKVRTNATATENLLSKRVRFGARVITRNGHDAIRELTGFFFSIDNTLTIYEFRQFGKSAKALPFVLRGKYGHLSAARKGEPYTLLDICEGKDIVVPSSGQHSLPETLKRVPAVTFRITEVDEQEKRNILLHEVPQAERDEAYIRLHVPTKQEYMEKKILRSVQGTVRTKLKKRGVKTLTGLGRYYRQEDSSGQGVLYRYQLEKGLFDYHIDLAPDTLDAVFELLDCEEKDELDYSVYMRGIIGEMNEFRKSLVRKAFRKIDAGKKGYLTLSDVQKFFNSTFQSHRQGGGDVGEVSPLQSFLDAVMSSSRQEEVSYVEFEEYYEGLSISVGSDDDFLTILKNTWTI